MSKRDVVVLGAARSAIGTFDGSLADIEPAELAGTVMKEAVKRSGVDPKAINYVTVGNTIPTESRFAYVARVAAIQAGLPMDSVAMSVNRLCSSGLQAIVTTAQNILLGDCDFGIGGGVEVMSRGGYMFDGHAHRRPHGRHHPHRHDGRHADRPVRGRAHGHHGRESRDQMEHLARGPGRAGGRIAHPRGGRDQGRPLQIADRARRQEDEEGRCRRRHRRACEGRARRLESLAKLKPAFKKDGTVTAGNASGINDGAAFFVLADAAVAPAAGLKPIARLVSYAVAGVPNHIMGEGPIPASKLALKKAGLSLDQMDVIES